MTVSFFEAFPDVWFLLNGAGDILDYKAPSTSELYLTPDRWQGQQIQSFVPKPVGAAFERTLSQVLASYRTETLEYSLVKRGKQQHYEARIIPAGEGQAIAIVRNISDRRQREQVLQHHAFHDPLTELPNRSLFMDRLGMALLRLRRFPRLYFAVFYVDLDDFKQINDRYGHGVGDEILKAIATLLQSCVRANDTVARLGGDEFTILLDSVTQITEVRTVAERILEKTQQPIAVGTHLIPSSVSIGIAVSAFRYQQAEDLLKDADAALYRAKQQGKGQYAIAELAPDASADTN